MAFFRFGQIGDREGDGHLYEEIVRLRYQVYVHEWGFEDPDDHPDGVETDAYDPFSAHFYARSADRDEIVGTIRLILGSRTDFPIEREFDIRPLSDDIPRAAIAEISRLAVSKDFRRRAIDRQIFGTHDSDQKNRDAEAEPPVERRNSENELVRGLYLSIYRYSKRNDITHWYAVMARGLYAILRRWGIVFEQVGPERDYHGMRAPYLASIAEVEALLARRNPELLQAARAGL